MADFLRALYELVVDSGVRLARDYLRDNYNDPKKPQKSLFNIKVLNVAL
jgi:hypothetical protein